jgi:hypothetical protein
MRFYIQEGILKIYYQEAGIKHILYSTMQNITDICTKPDLSDGSLEFPLKNLGILRQNMKKTSIHN